MVLLSVAEIYWRKIDFKRLRILLERRKVLQLDKVFNFVAVTIMPWCNELRYAIMDNIFDKG